MTRPPTRGTGDRFLASRGRRGRAEALNRYGGSGGTEDAVTRGLVWLAAHQDDDGKWDADGFSRHCPGFRDCDGPGKKELDVGVTALAVLAFLGAGYSPGEPRSKRSSSTAAAANPYESVVRRGVEFLLSSQRTDGAFGSSRNRWFFYNHAIATLAVSEAYGLSGDGKYATAAKAALRYSADFQQRGGGWDYQADETGRNDLSITGWQVMAFSAARALKIAVPRPMIRRTQEYLEGVVEPDGWAIYARKGTGSGRKGVNMAAVGLLSRLYLKTSPRDKRVQRTLRILLDNAPSLEKAYAWDRFHQSSYYWYVATLCLFHLGGEPWEAWNHFLKREIPPLQSGRGHEVGSWDPDPNWVGTFGGRVTTTALLVLTMEVYYRYPPLHSYR